MAFAVLFLPMTKIFHFKFIFLIQTIIYVITMKGIYFYEKIMEVSESIISDILLFLFILLPAPWSSSLKRAALKSYYGIRRWFEIRW